MVKAKSKRATGAETRTMEMEEISRRVREASRGANLAFLQPHFYLGGKPERRTLRMCEVLR